MATSSDTGQAAGLQGNIASSTLHGRHGSVSSSSGASGVSATTNPFPTKAPSPPPGPHFLDDNGSSYSSHTLRTIRKANNDGGSISGSSAGSNDPENPSVVHVNPGSSSNDAEMQAAQSKATSVERRRIVVRAFAQLAILFVVCAVIMGGTLYFALPDIEDEDKPAFKIPKNFDQLKALNSVLQRYKDENFGRVMLCWIMVYMFLQAFSIPGSMYMSILAGAMWGVPLALPVVCASVATGATICYLISKFLGEVLHAIPSWKRRVDSWKEVLDRQRDDMLSYLIVIRMMPVPPHNIVNILAPHLGIGIPLFWFSTFCGIFAVSVIHVTIGEKLDQMASPADFNLFTWRNALLLGGVCVAVLVPVVLRKRSGAARNPLEEGEAPQVGSVRLEGDEGQAGRRSTLLGRSGNDSDDDDELPPVRMRGAIAGVNRRGRNGEPGEAEEEDALTDDEADDEAARAWASEERSHRGSLSDDEASSLRGFRDRTDHRTQQRGNGYSSVRQGSKASRILGLGGSANGSVRLSGAAGSGAGGASITDSLAGGISSLWGKATGQRG